jgi:hypothetical protein
MPSMNYIKSGSKFANTHGFLQSLLKFELFDANVSQYFFKTQLARPTSPQPLPNYPPIQHSRGTPETECQTT